MANVLSETKRQQVVALGRLGWPLRRIEDATGVRRETASAYLKAAGIAIRAPGGWGRRPIPKPANAVSTDSADVPTAKPANEVSTDSAPPAWPPRPGRSPQASACEPFREVIVEALSRGRNAVAIWQDLVAVHGFTARYASVGRFVRQLRGTPTAEAHPVIATAPGEEAQVDYGDGAMVRDPQTGKYRRTRLFVLTLAASRKAVRLLTFQSSAAIWAQLHEAAFRRLGGVPRVVVLDNLKEGVLKPDVHDPTLNPLYRDMLAHYGAVALPCRVRHPDRKGKVESGVGHAQRTPLRGMRFETLAAAQQYLDHWEVRWADTRIHGTTKRQVAAMFAEEQPHLLPLPLEPFRYYEHGGRTVNLDGCVEVARAYYSVPPRIPLGTRVPVQWDDACIRILDPHTGQLIREHRRQAPGRHRIRDEDRPRRTPPSTTQLLARTATAGPSIGALCAAIHAQDGIVGIRRILGVLALAKQHGVAAIDDACAAALELGVPTYRFVRRYLERRAGRAPSLRQIDPLIRQLTLYRDHIDRQTTAQEISDDAP
jgi:transposase